MSKKTVYIVSELFYPETISTGYIMTEIAKSLASNRNVEVICGPEFYEANKTMERIPALDGLSTHRIQFDGYNKNSLVSRILGNLIVSFKIFKLMRAIIPKGGQVLMVTNPIFLLILTSFFIKNKKWQIKLLIHDVFPENLLLSNIFNSKNILYRILENFFNRAFLKFDQLIVLGRDMKDFFQNKINIEENLVIIENWADIENIRLHKPLDNEMPVFLFAGNMGRVQGIEVLLAAISNTKHIEYKFNFIGNGALNQYIELYVEKYNLQNVKKFGWKNREEQDVFLAQSSIGVVSLKKGMYGLGVPSKFYNLLAAGKPILYIGDINSEIYLILKENNIGWFAEAGNVVMISQVIEEIVLTDTLLLAEFSKNARMLAEKYYAKNIVLEKFHKIFDI